VLTRWHGAETTKWVLLLSRQGSAIVYVISKKEADDIAALLKRQGLAAVTYHTDMTDMQRSQAHKDFIRCASRVERTGGWGALEDYG
jgi:superfamily II DNA helicase RecQ